MWVLWYVLKMIIIGMNTMRILILSDRKYTHTLTINCKSRSFNDRINQYQNEMSYISFVVWMNSTKLTVPVMNHKMWKCWKVLREKRKKGIGYRDRSCLCLHHYLHVLLLNNMRSRFGFTCCITCKPLSMLFFIVSRRKTP